MTTFSVRKPGEEARRIMLARRTDALLAEVEQLRARSTWWRRLLCLLIPHRSWRTGLGGLAPDGQLYALHICRRCGKRWAEQGGRLQ